MRDRLTTCAFLALALLASGCAMTHPDHPATTNRLDRAIVPDNEVLQWGLTPVWIPLCALSLAVDNLIVTPAVHLPSVVKDTVEVYREMSFDITYPANKKLDSFYGDAGIFPLRLATCAVTFPLSWAGRSVLAIKPDKNAAWGWPEWGRRSERCLEHSRILKEADAANPADESKAR